MKKIGLKLIKTKLFITFFYIFFTNLYYLEFYNDFYQGNIIIGKVDANSQVKIDNKKLKVSKNGYFVFGIENDKKNDIKIEIINKKNTYQTFKKVLKKKYLIQKIDGLEEKKVTPPKSVYERIKNENDLIFKARNIDTDLDYFTKKFIPPVNKYVVTGVYGSQRILNGKPRAPHYGLDFAAPEGTPVKAMVDGIVTLAEKDLYFTGGTIIFDHGHGVSTLYMHLKDIYVKKNQIVKQGEIIGTIGKTGRTTGPHLDIRLNWFDLKLDPSSILNLQK